MLRPESRGPNTTRLLEYLAVDLVEFPDEGPKVKGRGGPRGRPGRYYNSRSAETEAGAALLARAHLGSS